MEIHRHKRFLFREHVDFYEENYINAVALYIGSVTFIRGNVFWCFAKSAIGYGLLFVLVLQKPTYKQLNVHRWYTEGIFSKKEM